MLELDANDCATVEEIDGSSWSSPWTMLSLSAWLAFHWVTKNSAQCSWSSPIEATGPVNGPIMPIWIGFEHDTVGAAFATAADAVLATPATATAAATVAPAIAISSPLLSIKPPSNIWGKSATASNRRPRVHDGV